MRLKKFNFLLILVFLGTQVFGNTNEATIKKEDFTKSYKQEYSVSATDKFIVDNRFGKIDIKTWDKSKVKIDVLITVKAKSSDDANEVFDRIIITFDQGTGYTSAKTEIEEKSSWTSWFGWGSSSDNYSIDYTVTMPAAHTLDLANKYGHSYVSSFNGPANFEVKYGDLFTEEIGGNVTLNLGYGNAKMGNMSNLDATIKYSELKTENLGDIKLNCKYSKIKLNNVGRMNVVSGYDDFVIKKAESLNYDGKYSNLEIIEIGAIEGLSKYTSFDIGTIHGTGKFELSYGGLKVNQLMPSFGTLDVIGKYSGIKITLHENTAFKLKGTAHYADIDVPEGFNTKRNIKQSSTHELEGHYKSDTGGSITLQTSYGDVRIW